MQLTLFSKKSLTLKAIRFRIVVKKINYIIYTLVIAFSFSFSINAQTLNEGKGLYLEGKFAEALPAFEKAIKSSPKNASYNQWYGTCLLETGRVEDSKQYLTFAASKKLIEAYNSLGKAHYLLYEFEESAAAFTKYKEALIKEKKEIAADAVTPLIDRSQRAARLLSNCEDIQIIDSVIIDKNNFLRAYSFSQECGILEMRGDKVVYTNHLNDKRYFADKEGDRLQLYSEINLQNNWTDKRHLSLSNDSISNDNYPFVLQDGITIYFASTGNNSIGGYDLFITRYNANNDSYFTPNQMGMPFNSIYNDYMMVIDEINNVGYFATDRYQPIDKVVIYTFIPNREVISINSNNNDELINRAKITSIKDSWNNQMDYKSYIAQLHKNLKEEQNIKKREFFFVINDKIIYYTLDDFENDAAKQAFLKSQQIENSIEVLNKELEEHRKEFAKGNRSNQRLNSNILSKESKIESLILQLEETQRNARNFEIKYLRK
ncbi:hypothetical protein M2138_000052 [Dysgonomonadaceae bacterium PH5-43]|nr:hypothetical protein [Dysgonomonadaceae bacterium PH5-43]